MTPAKPPAKPLAAPLARPGQTALTLALLALWAATVAWRVWGRFSPDLSALYFAGHFWGAGRIDLVYAAPEHFFGGSSPAWEPFFAALGVPPREGVYPFIYPPLWAALLAPLTRALDLATFHHLALILNVSLVAAAIPLAHRLAKSPLPLWHWALLSVFLVEAMTPAQSALQMSQPSILVAVLVLLAAERQAAGRPAAAGLALAAAAALKLTPLAFALLFLWRRDLRALLWLGAGLAAFALADRLLAGPLAEAAFRDALARAQSATLLSPVNLSLRALVGWAAGLAFDWPARRAPLLALTLLSPAARLALSAVSLAGAAALLAPFARPLAALPPGRGLALATLVLAVALNLWGPLGWQHYYLLPVLLLPAALGARPFAPALVALLPVVLTGNVLTLNIAVLNHMAPAAYVLMAAGGWLASLALLRRALRPAP